jgi:Gram-negative bacterial TonB protein C-terminal
MRYAGADFGQVMPRSDRWYTPRQEGRSVKKIFVLSLVLGIALGVAGTLLVQRGFRQRTPGLIRITTISSGSVHVDGVVQEQQLRKKVYSVYPLAAETGNITGTVLFRVVIAKDGSVESVEYLSGPSVFVESAKSAVQLYRYKPTVVGNMPAEVETIVAVPFVLPQ